MDKKERAFERPSFDEFVPVSYEEWKKEAVASLKGGEFDKKLLTKTYEGITLQPLYTKKDFQADEEFPGEGDYLRGTDPAGYLDESWTVAQAVSACCPEAANRELKHQLERGCTGVNVAPAFEGGVKLESEDDVKKLFDGIDLSKYPVQLNAGASALSLVKAMAGTNAAGCVGADPLGRLAVDGKLYSDMDALYGEMAECVRFAAEKLPNLRTVLVDGNVYANAGASAVQEVAYSMAAASEYIAAMTERGIAPDAAAGAIRFSFSLGANFFMEIAKLRAARVVFSKIAAAYGAGAEARKIDVFANTSAFTKTVYDPYVNILRATTEAFSGVVGGVNGMSVATLDEPIGASDELSERIARNIQIMLKEEFSLRMPVDPAGGSWYVETLTRQLIDAVSALFKSVEAEGGLYAALKAGSVQSAVGKVLADRLSKLAFRSDRAVGTNMYANMQEKPLVRESCERECRCCCSDAKPVIEVTPLKAHRWTEQFEALRAATEAYEASTGKTVKVFLANMGPIPQHKARADFSAGFFEVAHFEVLRNNGFATVEEAAEAAAKSEAAVAVICSTDDTYPELVPALARAIKAKTPDMMVMLAGAPAPEYKAAYTEAGVDDFIHVRSNCLEILGRIQSERGIG